ncbi:hypothetical protein BJY01DRAFT_76872 [Aspergillus pseudoustus]|uniref:Zn(2)-C6 fungal-type domain-containing protein n=1 Tax=Aspergillus pseudoustus TaxID=1810923 RepID=A0ABR4J5U8_9EURO
MSSKRIPCDSCRQRRVRCEGSSPCVPCQRAQLTCKREYIRKPRGPKHGRGKKIAALRAAQSHFDHDHVAVANGEPPGEGFLSPENLPRLMERCVDVYLHHMYPIMPLFSQSTLIQWLKRPQEPNEKSMLFALCALVTAFMCGHSESIIGSGEWAAVARWFIEKSLLIRSDYSFVEDNTVLTLLASFFVAVTYFELHNTRQSWFYLREAITLGHALGLHANEYYRGMNYVDSLYHRRIFNILFITERSLAIARHKPVLISRPLQLPAPGPSDGYENFDEQPEIDLGFRQLVLVYSQIDVEFLDFWSRKSPVCSSSSWKQCGSDLLVHDGVMSDAQRADICVTQQWLDLVLWRAALQQSLLSTKAGLRSRTFSYPEDIALSLLQVLTSLPQESVEVHGLGIFEKINDVGNTLADFIHCSTDLTGWTETMAQNLDRLSSIRNYLSLSPNANVKYAVSLGRRLAEFDLSYRSPLTRLPALDSVSGDLTTGYHDY